MDFYSAQTDAWQMADDLAEPIVILAGPDGYHAATEDEAARWMEDPDYTRADFVDVKAQRPGSAVTPPAEMIRVRLS